MTKEMKITLMEQRIHKMKSNSEDNQNIVKKLERQIRNIKSGTDSIFK